MKMSKSARFGEEHSKQRKKQLQRLRGGKVLGILEELEEQKVVTVWLECSEHWRGIKEMRLKR